MSRAVKGQAPTRSCPAPLPQELIDLLPALPADVRAKFVDVLADIANAELEASVNTDADRKE